MHSTDFCGGVHQGMSNETFRLKICYRMHLHFLHGHTVKSLKYGVPTLKLKYFSSRFAIVFAQYIEAKYWVESEDEDGAAPTSDVPTTSEWSTNQLPTKLRLILETWWYIVEPHILYVIYCYVSHMYINLLTHWVIAVLWLTMTKIY